MHIPTDGEVVEVVQVDIPTDDVLVAAALRSLGGAADDPIDEVRPASPTAETPPMADGRTGACRMSS